MDIQGPDGVQNSDNHNAYIGKNREPHIYDTHRAQGQAGKFNDQCKGNMSIAAHMKQHRMERAAKLLLESNDSIAQIAFSVGYESQSRFTNTFKQIYGMLPSVYRKKQQNVYTSAIQCP